ncbi:MAG: RNA binding protein fox-1-like protein [Nanoarchaeota archaeon]|nr:RNA binding protein fox-1-like protein [Nanoarchaeota archaeon]
MELTKYLKVSRPPEKPELLTELYYFLGKYEDTIFNEEGSKHFGFLTRTNLCTDEFAILEFEPYYRKEGDILKEKNYVKADEQKEKAIDFLKKAGYTVTEVNLDGIMKDIQTQQF